MKTTVGSHIQVSGIRHFDLVISLLACMYPFPVHQISLIDRKNLQDCLTNTIRT